MRITKSAILEAVHATAQGLHQAGAMDLLGSIPFRVEVDITSDGR